jgi:hypothetical protein
LITQSVDNIVVATEAAFIKALFVTSSGSIIPDLTIFTIFPVTTSNPLPSLDSKSFDCLDVKTIPALLNRVLNGALIDSNNISSPLFSGFKILEAFNKAIPPPGTIPSLIAALVAQIASSTLSLFSFNSISELAPIFTIATLALNLASLFSRPI